MNAASSSAKLPAKLPVKQAVWVVLCLILLAATAYMGTRIMSGGGKLGEDALTVNQRVIIHVAENRIEGLRVKPEAKAPEPPKPENAEKKPEKEANPETPAETAKPAEDPVKDKEQPKAETSPPTIPTPPVAEAAPNARPSGIAVPNAALIEATPRGLLPMISKEGAAPWRYYARPFAPPAERKPMVAIIVRGLGMAQDVTEQALRLPPEISLAFSPYARKSPALATDAQNEGHEVWVELPVEPLDKATDAGPYALATRNVAEENISRLQWVMSRFPGFAGVIAPEEEKLFRQGKSALPILNELGKRGVALFHPDGKTLAQMPAQAKASATPFAAADMVLDETLTPEAINLKLAELEALAVKNGSAIAVAHAYPVTLQQLAGWSESLHRKSVILAPVTALVQAPLQTAATSSAPSAAPAPKP